MREWGWGERLAGCSDCETLFQANRGWARPGQALGPAAARSHLHNSHFPAWCRCLVAAYPATPSLGSAPSFNSPPSLNSPHSPHVPEPTSPTLAKKNDTTMSQMISLVVAANACVCAIPPH